MVQFGILADGSWDMDDRSWLIGVAWTGAHRAKSRLQRGKLVYLLWKLTETDGYYTSDIYTVLDPKSHDKVLLCTRASESQRLRARLAGDLVRYQWYLRESIAR